MSEFEEREAAVVARKNLLADLVGAMADPTLVVDVDTRIILANDPAREVFVAVREGEALALL